MIKINRRSRNKEKGFTLIELLLVVAILGVLAAVIVPNISKFIGSGTVEAANTEAHNVHTAVIVYMKENNLSSITAGAVGPNHDLPAGSANTTPKSFLMNPSALQATYAINSNGEISGANATSGSEWASLTYTAGTG